MKVRQRLWWVLGGVLLLCVGFVLAAYLFGWSWSGFLNKTFWDWLQLLVIPVVIAVGGYVINLTISRSEQKAAEQREKTDREVASENQRESALQTYFDKMSELLLKEHLSKSEPDDQTRILARTRTLTVLSGLDSTRKAELLRFLQESRLIRKNAASSVLVLEGADLSSAKLDQMDLNSADLKDANLNQVSLSGAKLSQAHLCRADLRKANLQRAILNEADLHGANLRSADLRGADLSDAKLSGANLSDYGRFDADLRKRYIELKRSHRILWFVPLFFLAAPSKITLLLPVDSVANLIRLRLHFEYPADLSGANLSGAYLGGVNLRGANLSGTNLYVTDLSEADLSNANLSKSHVTDKQLAKAKSLKGATMPDGSKHP